MEEIGSLLNTPTMIAQVLAEAKQLCVGGKRLKSEQASAAFGNLKAVWDVMFPGERYKFIHALISEVTVACDTVRIEYDASGMEAVLKEAGIENAND